MKSVSMLHHEFKTELQLAYDGLRGYGMSEKQYLEEALANMRRVREERLLWAMDQAIDAQVNATSALALFNSWAATAPTL